jgi:hypothetical protein
MSITVTQLIELRLREWSRDYFKLNAPAAAGAVPVLSPVGEGRGRTFEYQIVNVSGAQLIGAPVNLTNETANLTPASLSLDTESFTLDNIDLGVFQISDSTADAFTTQAGGPSAVDEFVQSLMSRAYATHSLRTKQAAIAQLPFESLDVGDESFKAALDAVLLRVELVSGVRPNTILLGREAVTELSQRNFVRDFPAIAITTTTEARTGYANEESVRNYLQVAHGLRLVVDATAWKPTALDPREFIWKDAGVLTYVGGDGLGRQATMNTMVQYNSEIAKYEVRRNSGIQRIGFSVAAEGIFTVHARNPESGVCFSVDGSSSL